MLAHVITPRHQSLIVSVFSFLGQVSDAVQLPLCFCCCLLQHFNDAICSSNHYLTNLHYMCSIDSCGLEMMILIWPWESAGLTNRQRKGLQELKSQVLPVVVPEAKTGEFILPLSFLLLSFLLYSSCPEFYSSPCISASYHAFCNFAPPYLPPPVSPFAILLSFVFMRFTPQYPFTTCHSVTLLHPFYSQLVFHSPYLSDYFTPLFSSASSSAVLSVCLHLCSQLTFAMRRCSCARTEERATRTRSASVLQSLRGYCANTPAARQARTATPLLCRTSPWPPCCSALC